MTPRLSVADITSYLSATGWVRQTEEWRGASVWAYGDECEVLVPDSDGFADSRRRVRDILRALELVETRPHEHIASDIDAPMADVQWYRAPVVPQEGQFGLSDGVAALTGAQGVLTAIARTVVGGPRAVFEGAAPKQVRDLLSTVRIGPVLPSENLLTLRLPLDGVSPNGEPPLARRVLTLFQRVTPLLRDATRTVRETGAIEVFDDLVREGVSADLCLALARFAGDDPGPGFEVGVRWARALPERTPSDPVAFNPNTGRLLRQVGYRLRRLRQDDATVTGLIGTLFDDGRADRFRINVHGEVSLASGGTRRSLWVRLPDEATYDRAIEAHREGSRVTARGALSEVHGRLELAATSFERSADDPPEKDGR